MPAAPAATAQASPRRDKTSGSPYAHRLRAVAGVVAGQQLEALLVTNPKDVGYLTGFHGGDSYLVVRAGRSATGAGGPPPVLISDFRYKEELEPVEEIAQVFIRSRSMMDAIGEVLGGEAEGGGGRVGVQAEHMSVAERAAIGRKIGSKRLVDTLGVIPKLRLIKDETEIALIRKAAKIQEAALMAVLPTIKPGMSELEVAANLEAEMKSRGSSEPGFQTIVAAGPASSLPHYRPQKKKVATGKVLLIDWGAVYQGYHSDMTRTFALGKWPPKIAEIYAVVLEAQLASAAALAPGKSTAEVDGVARKIIAKAGYAEFFGHGLGHGLGLNAHEEPRLTNMLAASKLQPGMVVTVEPGIYLPGVGGVRIEDDYVITEDGAENLCSLRKTMEWGTL